MDLALTIDFGSTFTKGALFDLARQRVVAVAYQPSTVETDAIVGLKAVLTRLQTATPHPIEKIPARVCSSAAGGLRMAVIGLVPSLSLEAAQRAALGAGAKIIGAYGHKLTAKAIHALESSRPDIILLAGGIDGGDEATILHNAAMLAKSKVTAPIVVAGNQVVADECAEMLKRADRSAILAANILPDIDRIEVNEVHIIIRDLFVRHITHAKGIEHVHQSLNVVAPLIPTPSAVLRACQLLAEGTHEKKGWGDLVVVDIGGATTDIHSVGSGVPSQPGVILRGLPELFLKRTVEGDLGMRASAGAVMERAGMEQILGYISSFDLKGVDNDWVRAYVTKAEKQPEYTPVDEKEAALDAALARAAIRIAMRRHAGVLREIYTSTGNAIVQQGKNLSDVTTVIGVGGVLARGTHGRFALEGVIRSPEEPHVLCPEHPRFLIDRSYLLYGIGLLADDHPTQAMRMAAEMLISWEDAGIQETVSIA